ncbi:hypothetical protein CDIOL_52040 [Clostridium diolis]|uniref:Uncharacterized protein n=1 Tax=Clostridium diolis TaxID=223919 RepID=A0AAV3VFG4_9CLOT|nr:hypothetical protein CDIOL_36140 [Clostridium diolis]GEA34281.1 hypothetical protein CDIOL_52040 [Clostridium diolis]
MPSSRDISFSQISDLVEKLMQIALAICIPYSIESFVLSKLHTVSLMYLQLDYIGQALDLLVSVS